MPLRSVALRHMDMVMDMVMDMEMDMDMEIGISAARVHRIH